MSETGFTISMDVSGNIKNIRITVDKKTTPSNDMVRLLFGVVLRVEADHKPSSVFDDH